MWDDTPAPVPALLSAFEASMRGPSPHPHVLSPERNYDAMLVNRRFSLSTTLLLGINCYSLWGILLLIRRDDAIMQRHETDEDICNNMQQ